MPYLELAGKKLVVFIKVIDQTFPPCTCLPYCA